MPAARLAEGSKLMMEVYPNPVDDIMNLSISSTISGEGELQVYNLPGELIHSENLNIQEGEQYLSVDVSDWIAGVYLISISLNNNEQWVKFSVNH